MDIIIGKELVNYERMCYRNWNSAFQEQPYIIHSCRAWNSSEWQLLHTLPTLTLLRKCWNPLGRMCSNVTAWYSSSHTHTHTHTLIIPSSLEQRTADGLPGELSGFCLPLVCCLEFQTANSHPKKSLIIS